VLFGAHQQVVEFRQLGAVAVAARVAKVAQAGVQHVVHIPQHVNLPAQLRRRVKQNRQRVDVAAVNRGVHRESGAAPLVRHRIFAPGIKTHIGPLGVHMAEVGQAVGVDFFKKALLN